VQSLLLLEDFAKKARTNPAYAKAHNHAARTVGFLATKLRLTPRSRIMPRAAGRMAKKQIPASAYQMMDDD
jgi:hypothetical protein